MSVRKISCLGLIFFLTISPGLCDIITAPNPDKPHARAQFILSEDVDYFSSCPDRVQVAGQIPTPAPWYEHFIGGLWLLGGIGACAYIWYLWNKE